MRWAITSDTPARASRVAVVARKSWKRRRRGIPRARSFMLHFGQRRGSRRAPVPGARIPVGGRCGSRRQPGLREKGHARGRTAAWCSASRAEKLVRCRPPLAPLLRLEFQCYGRKTVRCSCAGLAGGRPMNAWRIGAAVMVALSLQGTSAMASGPDHDQRRPSAASARSRPAAPLAVKHAAGMKAKKTPAIKRTPGRDRSTDLELPQLG